MTQEHEDPRVRALLDAARALPREIEPPADVWAGVRDGIRSTGRHSAGRPFRWWHNGRMAAAAALLLVTGTAFVTWRLADRSGGSQDFVNAAPASVAAHPIERQFAETLAELHAALEEQRDALPAAAVQVIEQSLAVIDAAISDTRLVLARHPRDGVAADLLAAHYRRKVELLQRAARITTAL